MMKHLLYTITLLLLAALPLLPCQAQDSALFSNASTVNIDGTVSFSGVIIDDGGDAGNYSNNFAGMVVITARFGDTIEISGNYTTEWMSDYLYVYNGQGRTGTVLGTYSGMGSLHRISVTGVMTLYFTSNATTNFSGFSLQYTVHPSPCSNFITNFSYTNLTPTAATLSWLPNDPAGAFLLSYDGVDTTVFGSSFRVDGLSPNHDYSFSLSAIPDTGQSRCQRLLHLHTPCFPAFIRGSHQLCGSDTLLLLADSADSYLWSTGETSRSIGVTQPGVYTLVVNTAGGCPDTDQVRIEQKHMDIEINVPEILCPSDSFNVWVGFGSQSPLRVNIGQSVLSEAERIFLPDGIYCDPHGCSYRSELVFSDFPNDARITDVNDIRYVMLNIEHSYVGDLYINITCPNNQSADILRYGGNGNSNCNSTIGSSSRGWQSGSNASMSTDFGVSDPLSNGSNCDSTDLGNRPGTGWRYCWSDATDAGYTYAAGDGLVYRLSNAHNNSLDSSNVLLGTHFYHPDQSLASLIGCPMNGTWYIEVIDGWIGDNGYIFGWSLALNPDRLSRNEYRPTIAYVDLLGPWNVRRSDTSFCIIAPDNLLADTTVQYTVHILDSSGCRFDTTFSVTFLANVVGDTVATACDSFDWRGNSYHHSVVDTLTGILPTVSGCDSIIVLHLTLNQSTTSVYTDTCIENLLPRTFNDSIFYTDTTGAVVTIPNTSGCDSLITYNLHVLHNVFSYFDTTVCFNSLPLTWRGILFTQEGSRNDTLSCLNGADSIVIHTLQTFPNHFIQIFDTICQGSLYEFNGQQIAQPGKYTDSLLTTNQCDSVIQLQLQVLDTIPILFHQEHSCRYPVHYLVSCDSSSGHLYQWTSQPYDPALNGQLHSSLISVNPSSPTCYFLTVNHANTALCASTDSLCLQPIVPLHATWQINVDGRQIEATNTSFDYISQDWYIDGQLSDNHSSHLVYFANEQNDTLRLTLVISNELCADTLSEQITLVLPTIYFPNVFTPGAGSNNRFSAIGNGILEYEIWIFDRQGAKVYHSTDINEGWDGTAHGKPCRQAAYVYFCRYRDVNSAAGYQTAKGTVLLLR